MNGSKRTISRILAFVMLVSAMFTNVMTASADVNDVSLIDSVISSAAAVVDSIIDDDAEDLAAPAVPEGVNKILSYEDYLDAASKTPLSEQVYDPYFTVTGDVVTKTSSGIELAKNDGGSISFTVGDGSHMKLYAGSTGGTNSSNVTVENTGTGVKLYDDIVSGTTKDALTFESDLSAGTYKVYTTDTGRAMRIYYLYVTDPTAQSETPVESTSEAATEKPSEAVSEEPPVEVSTEAAPPVEGGSLDEKLAAFADGSNAELKAYAANDVIFDGLTASQALSVATDGGSVFTDAEGNELTYSKATEENNCLAAGANGDAISFTAPSNGKFAIAFKVSSGKNGVVFGETVTAGASSAYLYREYDVEAGTTYTAGLPGSKIRIFAMAFKAEGAEESTEALTEASTEAPTTAPETEASTEAPTTAPETEASTEAPTTAPVEGGSLDEKLAAFADGSNAELKAYAANDVIFDGLTASQALSVATDGGSVFTDAEGNELTYSKATEENNCLAAGANGDAISFTAPSNGKFAIAFKVSSGKNGVVFGETVTAGASSAYLYREYNVEAGTTYTAGLPGSKIRIFAMAFKKVVGPVPDVPDPDIPTETTTVTEAQTEAPTEKTSEAVTETPVETSTESAPIEGGSLNKDTNDGVTPFWTASDTSAGLEVTYDEATGEYFLNDTSETGTADLYFPLAGTDTAAKFIVKGTITPLANNNSWTLVQLVYLDDANKPTEVAGIRTDGGNYKLRTDGGSTFNDTTVPIVNGTKAEYSFTVDKAANTVVLTVDGKSTEPMATTRLKATAAAAVNLDQLYIRLTTATKSRSMRGTAPTVEIAGEVEESTQATTAAEESTQATTAAEESTQATTEGQGGGGTDTPVDPNSLDAKLNCTAAADIKAYAANDVIFDGLTASQALTVATDGAAFFTDKAGNKLTYSKATASDNCISASANGEAIKFVAPADGVVKIAFKVGSGKNGEVFGEAVSAPSASVYLYREYNVKAGETYTAGLSGSKIRIFYIGFTAGGVAEEPTAAPTTEGSTETSTEAPTEGSTEAPAESGKWGDVDNDGDVDATDVALTYAFVIGSLKADTFIEARADVDGREGIDSADVATILQKVLDKEWLMPVEESGEPAPEPPAEGPEPGKTYDTDFAQEIKDADLKAGDPIDGFTTSDGIVSISSPQGYAHDDTHGLALYDGDKITVKVAGNATISVKTCQYGNGEIYNVKNEAGEIIGTIEAKGGTDGEVYIFDYIGEAATLTLELVSSGEAYLHSLSIANSAAPLGEAKSFMLWFDDLAYDVEGADGAVTKTVDAGTLTGVVNLVAKEGSVDLGDNKLALVTAKGQGDQDKFNAGKDQFKGLTVLDRTDVNAYWGGKRHTSPNDIPSIPVDGDAAAGSSLVFTPAEDGMLNVWYQSGSFLRIWDFNLDGSRNGYVDDPDPTGNVSSLAISVKTGHIYVLSTTGKTSNLGFVNVEYVKTEPITVSFKFNEDGKYDYSNVDISLTDADLGGKVVATFKAGDGVTANLMNGHSYKLSTNDGGAGALVAGSDTFKVEGAGPYTIDLVEIPDVTLTGKFIGGEAADVKSVTFTSMVSGATYEAELTADGYTASVKPGEYNTTVASDKYYTKDRARVIAGQDNTDDIYLESLVKSEYILPEELAAPGTALKINNNSGNVKVNNSTSIAIYAGDSIVVPVSGKQKVTVSGWYSGAWNINGQDPVTTDSSANAQNPTISSYITNGTETEVTVNVTGDGTNYLYWIKVEDIVEYDANKTVLQVPSAEFPTLKDAVAYIRNMSGRPEGEAGRMTIELTADVQEQIVFDAPYITLDGKGHEINWYYGQTGLYYSVDPATGLYNETLFYDRYDKTEGNGSLWGGVAIIRGDYFRTVNTTYRNTFNYEVTDKEIEDGAENRNTVKGIVDKTWNVQQYSAKERSNAFYIEAKGIEIDKCKILSTQDTFGRNGSTDGGYSVYVKDSVIGGNTDYICGEFKAVFDNCELQWYSFENDQAHNEGGSFGVGYICAPKTNPYVFRNCNVTTRGAEGEGNKVEGLWGRTWGAGSKAYFVNCETNGHIMTSGWGQMNGGDIATAVFGEYGNTENGQPFVTSGELVPNPAVTDPATIDGLTTDNIIDAFLGGWTPSIYEKVPAPELPETKAKIWVVGDSTGCHYENTDKNYYYQRVGFGDKIADYFYADVENLAVSGRSSTSLMDDPQYATLLAGMKQGDYLFIAFGHNDEKKGDPRYTAPGGTKEDAGTFKNSLYTNYILPAQKVGAIPVLCTPIVRRTETGTWSDNQQHKANGGDYAQDIRDLAKELGILCIDNTQATKDLYDRLTPGAQAQLDKETGTVTAQATGSAALHAANALCVPDNTHINNYGAKYIAYLMANAVKATDDPLKAYVLSTPAPTTADIIVNPDWAAPSSSDPTGEELVSKLWKTTDPWHGSVFGNVGGQGKLLADDPNNAGQYLPDVVRETNGVKNFDISENADGSVNIRNGIVDVNDETKCQVFGKISGTDDGMTLYYQPINNDNVQISGTITVNGYNPKVSTPNQIGFGGIILDTILKADDCTATTFPYVAAGMYRFGDIGTVDAEGAPKKAVASFGRIDAAQVLGTPYYEQHLAPGTKVYVNLKKVGDTITTTTQVEGGEAVTDTYTLHTEGTIYAGFFAARCMDLTVSDIKCDSEVVE